MEGGAGGEDVFGVSKDHRGGLGSLRAVSGFATAGTGASATGSTGGVASMGVVGLERNGLRPNGTETGAEDCLLSITASSCIFVLGCTASANLTPPLLFSFDFPSFPPGATSTPFFGAARSCAGALHPGPLFTLGVTTIPSSLPPFAFACNKNLSNCMNFSFQLPTSLRKASFSALNFCATLWISTLRSISAAS